MRFFKRGATRIVGSVRPDSSTKAAAFPSEESAGRDTSRGGLTTQSVESMLRETASASVRRLQRTDGVPVGGNYDELWQLSMADPQTGLANRLLIEDRLGGALARRARRGEHVVVIHMVLVNLGAIQADIGYSVGNDVLAKACKRLASVLRNEDTIGRLGADTFAAVLSTNSESGTQVVVDRLRSVLATPFVVAGVEYRLLTQFVVVLAGETESAEQVLARAAMAVDAVQVARS